MYLANFTPLDHLSWGMGGWLGGWVGWVWKMRLMLTQLPTELELKLELSLAKIVKKDDLCRDQQPSQQATACMDLKLDQLYLTPQRIK